MKEINRPGNEASISSASEVHDTVHAHTNNQLMVLIVALHYCLALIVKKCDRLWENNHSHVIGKITTRVYVQIFEKAITYRLECSDL